MSTYEETIPAECPHRDIPIHSCLIAAPRVFLLQQLLICNNIMQKQHQRDFRSRRQLQSARFQTTGIVDRSGNAVSQDVHVKKMPPGCTIFHREVLFEVPRMIEETRLSLRLSAQ